MKSPGGRRAHARRSKVDRDHARQIGLANRWKIIARHAEETQTGGILLCCPRTSDERVVYGTEQAAIDADRELHLIGAHTKPTYVYQCPNPRPRRGHYHLTSAAAGGKPTGNYREGPLIR